MWRTAFVLLVSWIVGCGLLAALIVYVGTSDEALPSDVIIVLGAALTDDGKPYKALTRRAEHAAALWRKGLAPMVLCTGGIGETVRIARSEADGCREVLMREGVPRTAIVLEETSRSTEENVRNARDVMATHEWHSAIVVSDSYHVFRARYLARRAGINAVMSPVPMASMGPLPYVFSLVREIMALHQQLLGL